MICGCSAINRHSHQLSCFGVVFGLVAVNREQSNHRSLSPPPSQASLSLSLTISGITAAHTQSTTPQSG